MGYVVKLGEPRPSRPQSEPSAAPDRSRTLLIAGLSLLAALLVGMGVFFLTSNPRADVNERQVIQQQEAEGLADRQTVLRSRQGAGYLPAGSSAR